MTALFDVRPVLALAKRGQANTISNSVLALLVGSSKTITVSKHVVHFFQSEALGFGYEEQDEKAAGEGESLC